MDTHDLDDIKCDIPESFKTICNLIRKQVVTYDEAWSLMKDLIGNKENNTTPYYPPLNPYPEVHPYHEPYIGHCDPNPYFDDCMGTTYTSYRRMEQR